jgi:serine/threonine protein kinase
MNLQGSKVGPIRIETLLGRGGMGEVYLGFDEILERKVAVKTIRAENRLSRRAKGRFLREARLLSRLGHPAICQVYNLIETPEADFLVLEYVEGKTLRTLAAEGLDDATRLRLSEKIAAALAVAHRERIVHRDLKADNVMITPAGEVKILDFGIARSVEEESAPLFPELDLPDFSVSPEPPPPLPRPDPREPQVTQIFWPGANQTPRPVRPEEADLTHLGLVVGTARAMSPEQAAGDRVTEASDLYSLGILLQELFTGQRAYAEGGAAETVMRVLRAETRPIAGLDPELTALIRELESLDPHRRPSAEETARRLRELIDKPQRLRRRRWRRGVIAGSFLFLLAVLLVVSVLAWTAVRAREEANRRRQQAEALIGFMIGDLQPRLGAVGRLDILNEVGRRALAYFGAVPESQLSDTELYQRVIAIRQIGEVRREQGQLPAAIAALRRSTELSRQLVARDPAREDWELAYLDASTWLGQALLEQGDGAAAFAIWTQTRERIRRQLRRQPRQPLWLSQLGIAEHNLGTVLELRGDLAGALAAYQRSLALQRQVSALEPGDLEHQAALAATLAFVSNNLERQGDLAAALRERRAHLAIQERLAALAPEDQVKRRDLAIARGFVAGLLVVLGEREEARRLFESGLETIGELTRRDAQNRELRRWLGAFHSTLGWVSSEDGDFTAARRELDIALPLFESLVAEDPSNVDWQLQRGVALNRRAAAELESDPSRARASARAALAILEPLAESLDDAQKGYAAQAAVTLGHAEQRLGNSQAAHAAWEKALALLAPCAQPWTHWRILQPAIAALDALGRDEEARPLVERLQRSGAQLRERPQPQG